ncbi:hypothetical protein IWZ03DRAFT_173209 [Phyllosticta citriasiana]|uniref:Uncharacterized protein n=1 Tax=Phyllosticta citriasiana TaxID=595635 RepID=A0ABR1KLX1_9PEZI
MRTGITSCQVPRRRLSLFSHVAQSGRTDRVRWWREKSLRWSRVQRLGCLLHPDFRPATTATTTISRWSALVVGSFCLAGLHRRIPFCKSTDRDEADLSGPLVAPVEAAKSGLSRAATVGCCYSQQRRRCRQTSRLTDSSDITLSASQTAGYGSSHVVVLMDSII